MKTVTGWAVVLVGTLAAYSMVLNAVVPLRGIELIAEISLLVTFALMMLWCAQR